MLQAMYFVHPIHDGTLTHGGMVRQCLRHRSVSDDVNHTARVGRDAQRPEHAVRRAHRAGNAQISIRANPHAVVPVAASATVAPTTAATSIADVLDAPTMSAETPRMLKQ
jgi:hypothetical protein